MDTRSVNQAIFTSSRAVNELSRTLTGYQCLTQGAVTSLHTSHRDNH